MFMKRKVYLGRHGTASFMSWTRASQSVYAYCKRSKTGRWEGLAGIKAALTSLPSIVDNY